MNHELAKTLTTALVQFIDRERPEGSMCCSSAECEKIEKAFEGGTYDVVEKLIKKKLLDMTEFELEVSDIVEYCKEHGENVAFDYAKRHAKTLLALAKKELPMPEDTVIFQKGVEEGRRLEREESHENYVRGYANGYKDAEKQYNESVAYHFPIMPTPPSGCGCDGTHCTNPHGDCINCPKRFTTGGTITTPNTSSGTSTATLHGNTSVTDGNRILFFTSKPRKWNRVFWQDYNNYSYRIAGIMPRVASDYEGLLELPEGKAIEVELRIKVVDK